MVGCDARHSREIGVWGGGASAVICVCWDVNAGIAGYAYTRIQTRDKRSKMACFKAVLRAHKGVIDVFSHTQLHV
jgi:hypothetical protein